MKCKLNFLYTLKKKKGTERPVLARLKAAGKGRMNDTGTSLRIHTVEPVIQREVGQKEKNNYHMLAHTHGIQNDGTDEPICRAVIAMQTQRTDLCTQRGKERAGLIEGVALKHTRYRMQNVQPVGMCCTMQGAQT